MQRRTKPRCLKMTEMSTYYLSNCMVYLHLHINSIALYLLRMCKSPYIHYILRRFCGICVNIYLYKHYRRWRGHGLRYIIEIDHRNHKVIMDCNVTIIYYRDLSLTEHFLRIQHSEDVGGRGTVERNSFRVPGRQLPRAIRSQTSVDE